MKILLICLTFILFFDGCNSNSNISKKDSSASLDRFNQEKQKHLDSLELNNIDFIEFKYVINNINKISYVITYYDTLGNQSRYRKYNYNRNGSIENFVFSRIEFDKIIKMRDEPNNFKDDFINYVSIDSYVEINIHFKYFKKKIIRYLNSSQKNDKLSENIYNYIKDELFYLELKKNWYFETQVEQLK